MEIKIKETGKIENLIIKDKNGVDFAADLVGENNVIGLDENGVVIITQDDFDWWTGYFNDRESTSEDTDNLIDELIDADLDCPNNHVDCPDTAYCWECYVRDRIDRVVFNAMDLDCERKFAIAEIDAIRAEFLSN